MVKLVGGGSVIKGATPSSFKESYTPFCGSFIGKQIYIWVNPQVENKPCAWDGALCLLMWLLSLKYNGKKPI